MARPLNKLSARAVQTLTTPKRHGDGGGLWLSISRNGGRRWTFLYRWRGKLTEMGLGSARDVSLARARDLAVAARAQLAAGVNPLAARRAPKAEMPSFGAFADSLIDDLESGFHSAKHVAQWRMTLTQYAAPLRPRPLADIDTEDVLACLKPLWTKRPETASRLRGRIERVLDAAKAKGLRSGENPARWRGHLDQLLPKRQKLTRGHHPALPFEAVPDFMAQLRTREAPAARALEFLILTACRSGEVRNAEWREIDVDKGVWTIPAARMKSKREHRVPLTTRMLAILKDARAKTNGDLVFPGPTRGLALSDSAFKVLLDRMGFGEITPHGFRSSFRDWTSELTDFSREVAEMALAHVIEDKTEAAYRRRDLFDKRRELMQAWELYCSGQLVKQPRRGSLHDRPDQSDELRAAAS
ncbi:MAG: integrase arm-type DNA-binding domain-containing protein [Hyphomonadaceae bacterium]|nr:integrase arm-type DNA-binding domain-containing protein [Hyphomonadaceae bacterium]